MKNFLITVTFSDPYPRTKEYREETTKFDFACKKALAKFRRDFKGKRLKSFTLRCDDLGTVGQPVASKPTTPDETNKRVLDGFFQKHFA